MMSEPEQPTSELEKRLARWDERSDKSHQKRMECDTSDLSEPEWGLKLSEAELEEVKRAIG